MTKEEWKQAEEALTHFFHPVELKVDGYDITLILERVGVYQNKIMVYIGGEFRGQWMAEDCDERRRFLHGFELHRGAHDGMVGHGDAGVARDAVGQERKHSILSGKQMAEFERLPKRRQKELREKYPMQYSCFTPQWSSFRALKKHFCANNQSIELVKV